MLNAWVLSLVLASSMAYASDDVQLEAGQLEQGPDGVMRAVGSPRIIHAGSSFEAETMEYDESTGILRASGGVKITGVKGEVIAGDDVEYNVTERRGEMSPAEVSFPGSTVRLGGVTLHAEEDSYRLEDAYYTTCPADSEVWKLVAEKLVVDNETRLATASSMRFELGGVPAMYFPWMTFPIDSSTKRSGLLTPQISTRSGGYYELETPIYLHLADNYDATFSPRLISDRGVLFGNEFRYLTRKASGEMSLSIIPSDRLESGEKRYHWRSEHEWFDGGPLSYGHLLEKVSDAAYFEDYADSSSSVARRNFLRNVWVDYDVSDDLSLFGEVEKVQHIRDDSEPPYDTIPRLAMRYQPLPDDGIFNFGADAEVSRFRASWSRADDPDRARGGTRLYVNPELSAFPETSWVNTEVNIGMELAAYLISGPVSDGDSSPNYAVPYISVDSSLPLRGTDNAFSRGWLQSFEPRIFYVYVPQSDQSDIPVFDTAVADDNILRYYRRNRFSGKDRIAGAHFVTYGVDSNIWDPGENRQVLRFRLAQRYFFRRPREQLEGEQLSERRLANIVMSARAWPSTSSDIHFELQWDPYASRADQVVVDAQKRLDDDRILSMSYAKSVAESDGDLGVGAIWPLADGIRLASSFDYNLEEHHMSESTVGAEISGSCGCWRVNMVLERFVENVGDDQTRFFLQLDLVGFGSLGDEKFVDIEESVRDLF